MISQDTHVRLCPLSLAARKSGRRKWFGRLRPMQCLRAARYKRTQKPEGTGGVLIGRQRREPQ